MIVSKRLESTQDSWGKEKEKPLKKTRIIGSYDKLGEK